MALTCVVLVLATTISSGCQDVSVANLITSMEEETVEAIKAEAETFNFDEYLQFDSDERALFIKQEIYGCNEENQLLSNDYLSALQSTLDENSSYSYSNETETMIANDDVSYCDITDNTSSTTCLSTEVSYKTESEQTGTNSRSLVSKDLNFSNFNDGSGGSNGGSSSSSSGSSSQGSSGQSNNASESVSQLPIHTYDTTAVSSTINGRVDDICFVGLIASKDACIDFYNTVSDFLNNQAMVSGSGIRDLSREIIELVLSISSTSVILSSIIAKLLSFFATIWEEVVALFASTTVIGFIVFTLFSLFVVLCIDILVLMFTSGYRKKGFAIGWKVHSLFNWEWVCGETD